LLLPLVAVLCLAIGQIVPFPGASVISVDPYETKAFILTFGGLIVTGEVLFVYSNSRHRLKCLIGLVIATGVSSAIFGILRGLYLDDQPGILEGYLPPAQGYAQFLNRNHFALLLEMAFGLLLGILIKGELSQKLKFWGWFFAGIMIYAAITANSRGGIISFAALVLFAVAVHLVTRNERFNCDGETTNRPLASTRQLVRKISIALAQFALVFAMIVITIAFVGGDRVVTRIERLKSEVEPIDNTKVNRNFIWNSTLDLIKTEPVLGVGFGGYATGITRVDTSGGKHSPQQAHNDYLEILANGGVIGFVLFGAFGALVVSRTLKNLKSSDRLTKSSCFGAAIGIFGVLIHSFVDFGLHIMINALIFAVLVVIATIKRVDERGPNALHQA
jgi:O-antigen ligase